VTREEKFWQWRWKRPSLCNTCTSEVIEKKERKTKSPLFSCSDVVFLELENCIGDEGMRALAESLKVNKSLRHLNLSCKRNVFSFSMFSFSSLE
jgi:hypothetical protein